MKIIIPPKGNEVVTQEQRDALVTCARSCIGIRWQHMGRNRNGLDCAGLLILVVHEVLGVWVEISDYSSWPSTVTMRQLCNQALIRKNGKPELGDVLLLYAAGYGTVHLGWYTGNTLIHASNDGPVKAVLEEPINLKFLKGVYEVPQYVGE